MSLEKINAISHRTPMETLPSLTLSEAESFAKKAVREATPADMRGRCVDGRTEAGEGSGVYAMAGGDAGLLGVALAAAERLRGQGVAITDEQVRDAVFETIGGKESFSYHTDDHTPDGQYGCAHCKFMLRERSAEYGLSEDQVRFMEATLADLSDQRVKPMPLRGSHKERAVMIVHTVADINDRSKPLAEDAKTWVFESQVRFAEAEGEPMQSFVYQADQTAQRLHILASAVASKAGGEASLASIESMLKDVEQMHLTWTVSLVAPLLPKFDVYIDQTGAVAVFPVAGQIEMEKQAV